jgi:hypothetical protein
VVSFTPRPFYARGKSSRYPLDRRLNGSQSRSGRRGEEKNLDPTSTQTPTPRPSSPLPVAIPTALSQIRSEMQSIILPEDPKGTGPFQNFGVETLKRILKNRCLRTWTELICLWTGPSDKSLRKGNEPSDCINYKNVTMRMRTQKSATDTEH